MCGIFGYYNYEVARDRATIVDFLINGLRRLEYRGYDSAGICVDGVQANFEAACNGNGTLHRNGYANGELQPFMAVSTGRRSGFHTCKRLMQQQTS